MSEKMREAIVAYMAAGVGNSTDYEKQADARRLAMEALAEQPDREKYSPFANSENSVETHTASKQPAQGEPVAWRYESPSGDCFYTPNHVTQNSDWKVTPLYTAPPAPSVPDGWLRAIDEAMVVHHAGVANATDTYEEARLKINLLLCIAQDIGALHAVPDGWKLVPVEPADEMIDAGRDASNAPPAAPEVPRG